MLILNHSKLWRVTSWEIKELFREMMLLYYFYYYYHILKFISMYIKFIPCSSAALLHFSRMNTNYQRGLWLSFRGNQTMCLKFAVSSFHFLLAFLFCWFQYLGGGFILWQGLKELFKQLERCIHVAISMHVSHIWVPGNIIIFVHTVAHMLNQIVWLQGNKVLILLSSYPVPKLRRCPYFSKCSMSYV